MIEQEYDPSKVKRVKMSEVHANTWNPKVKQHEKVATIEQSIKKHGFKQPIQVRTHPSIKGEYEIIDGEQRWTAMGNIGADYIYIYDNGEVSDADAQNETLWWQVQVPFEKVELAKLVNELEAMEMEMPYSAKEVAEIKKALEPKTTKDEEQKEKTSIKLTAEQYHVVMDAVEIAQDGDKSMPVGRALELIAADFISGN